MQRSFPSLNFSAPLSAALIAALLAATAGPAMAQSTQNTAPPKAQSVEPGSDVPTTNIPPKRGTQIVEHRDNSGQVSEVEVTAGGSHYTMKPNNQPGNAQTTAIRAPQWTVGQFDLSGKRHASNDAGQNAPTSDAPPPMPEATAADKKASDKK